MVLYPCDHSGGPKQGTERIAYEAAAAKNSDVVTPPAATAALPSERNARFAATRYADDRQFVQAGVYGAVWAGPRSGSADGAVRA